MQDNSKDVTIWGGGGREGTNRKLAYCRNTITVKLLSADKLHCANQEVDSNYPCSHDGIFYTLSC